MEFSFGRRTGSRRVEMLVLTRRVGETIVIDDQIRLTVVGVQGNKVRLGVVAPETVRVDREEVHRRLCALATEFGMEGEDLPARARPHGTGVAGEEPRRRNGRGRTVPVIAAAAAPAGPECFLG
jgi:carbon storage regulator